MEPHSATPGVFRPEQYNVDNRQSSDKEAWQNTEDLHWRELAATPECPWCGHASQDADYLMLHGPIIAIDGVATLIGIFLVIPS